MITLSGFHCISKKFQGWFVYCAYILTLEYYSKVNEFISKLWIKFASKMIQYISRDYCWLMYRNIQECEWRKSWVKWNNKVIMNITRPVLNWYQEFSRAFIDKDGNSSRKSVKNVSVHTKMRNLWKCVNSWEKI